MKSQLCIFLDDGSATKDPFSKKNLAVFCNHKIHLFISIRLRDDYSKQINTPDSYFHL